MNQIQRDIITGHESAIADYKRFITELDTLKGNKVVDAIIEHYNEAIKALQEELQLIKRL